MANKKHELPVILIVPSPPGHASKADAVLDDVEQLAVGQMLCCVLSQIRRGWVKPSINHRLPGPVVRMAEGAVVREVIPPLSDVERARRQRVGEPLGSGRRGQ